MFLIGKPKNHNSNQIPSFVVGCKSDLGDEMRKVTKYEAQAFAVKHGARYVHDNFRRNNNYFSIQHSSCKNHDFKSSQL